MQQALNHVFHMHPRHPLPPAAERAAHAGPDRRGHGGQRTAVFAQHNADTGEGNPRNSVSVGNGVYRSVDGGKTWKHLGLEKTERIYRIVLHPSNPDVAWVSAMGQEWGENPDRGVFKTVDAGKTWTSIKGNLPANWPVWGIAEDHVNRNLLFAGTEFGLFFTVDGGLTSGWS